MDKYIQRGKDFVAQYAKNNGQDKCVKCGTTDKLEWDHIDPSTKSFVITQRYHWTTERLENELKKCQRLCRPCHIAKTAKENKDNPECRRSTGRPKISDKKWVCKNCGNTERSYNSQGNGYCKPCARRSVIKHRKK